MYPWGKSWPPPDKAGNYCDRQAANRHTDWVVIAGYDDGFAETAPVGSFKPNAYGIYDLGGNAWEWCEDWYDSEHTRRVLRGASWYDYDRETLLAACRNSSAADSRFSNRGFRVVAVGMGP
jgi:formylglycine-generating enzyme required for sulfatase activity